MKIAAVICEYNPMHSGHIYQLKQTVDVLSCDKVIAVMSGSFTQRGIPAIYDKWARTKAALNNGADMVIELPQIYCSATAERFAAGGVLTAAATGITDILSFGCETEDISMLTRVSELMLDEPREYRSALEDALKSGLSFASARSKAADAVIRGASTLLNEPNSILAVEYIKALKKAHCDIQPFAVLRKGQGEREAAADDEMPSALSLRTKIRDGADVAGLLPESISRCYRGLKPVFKENLFELIKYRILTSEAEEIRKIADVSEGLENKIKTAALSARSFDELVFGIKSKRYTYTKICRILTALILGITEEASLYACENGPEYIRVSGVKKDSLALLSMLSEKASVPVITSPKTFAEKSAMLRLDITASDIRSLYDGFPSGRDYTEKLIII